MTPRGKQAADLEAYRAKRAPDRTPEPFDSGGSTTGQLYVMQKHAARNLHYDLRLELDGVLKSWAVPKDPSYDQGIKRAAFMVEDHPVEYATFEGVIPKGNYGAGEVIVWDRGVWVPLEDPHEGLDKGKLLFELRGHRMRGRWTLVKVKRGENEWLLIKERDALEGKDRDTFSHDSILTGRTLEDLRTGRDRDADLTQHVTALDAPRRALAPSDMRVMLAETRREPFDDDGWVFELKYDGYRVLGGRSNDEVTLRSRNGNDMARALPDIADALARLPFTDFIVDGEVVVHDDAGLPSFQRLQKRARLTRGVDIRRAAAELPATLYVFDLLAFGGHDLRRLPLLKRKELLRELLPTTGTLRYSDHIVGRGRAFFDLAESMQLEGIIGKRADGVYRSGRSHEWVKIRASKVDDFVVIGLKASKSTRGTFGSLHIAQYDGDRLVYAGSVGTGLTPKHMKEVIARAGESTGTRPAIEGLPKTSEDRWVEPRVVVEVRYLERTEAGQLRHPVFLRLRDDKEAAECVLHFEDVVAADARSQENGVTDAQSQEDGVSAGRSAEATLPTSPLAAEAALPTSPQKRAGRARHRVEAGLPKQEERSVRFTNEDKVLWPEDGYTKGDLIAYYRAIAGWMLPYLRDRPVVQTRFPDGINGKSFFQKDAPEWAPAWLRRETVWSDGSERELSYFIADDTPSLEYLANNASIPLHIWSSRIDAPGQPDWCSLDLDPKGAPFDHVIRVAQAVHRLCDSIGLPNYVKTSGSSGLHVLIPLGRQCTHEQAKLLGELLARHIVGELPDIASIARIVSQREGRVYVDYLQNGRGKLLVAPFCVRPLPGAPVSMPLRWSEVKRGLTIAKHTIRTATRRMARLKEDPMAAVLTETPDLIRALAALSKA
ncbi:MAG TPA: DNA ligase D [Longimicrobiales bacterium]|nr:DNA ligase D [Longimicrobiales bacterium]